MNERGGTTANTNVRWQNEFRNKWEMEQPNSRNESEQAAAGYDPQLVRYAMAFPRCKSIHFRCGSRLTRDVGA